MNSANASKVLYSKDHERLVRRLISARNKAKLSQVEAAKLLGTTQPNISMIESGQRKIDAIELKRMAKIYKQPIHFFFE